MNFKIDENLPIDLVSTLRNAGHDALTVLDEYPPGTRDVDILAKCLVALPCSGVESHQASMRLLQSGVATYRSLQRLDGCSQLALMLVKSS